LNDLPPLPDPGVPDGLKIPLFAISLPIGVLLPLASILFKATSLRGVTSLSLRGSWWGSSSERLSVEKLSGSVCQLHRMEFFGYIAWR
jgi:hypothetical protein